MRQFRLIFGNALQLRLDLKVEDHRSFLLALIGPRAVLIDFRSCESTLHLCAGPRALFRGPVCPAHDIYNRKDRLCWGKPASTHSNASADHEAGRSVRASSKATTRSALPTWKRPPQSSSTDSWKLLRRIGRSRRGPAARTTATLLEPPSICPSSGRASADLPRSRLR
jgi:hypothetical protein